MTDGDSFSHVLKLSIWGEPEPTIPILFGVQSSPVQ